MLPSIFVHFTPLSPKNCNKCMYVQYMYNFKAQHYLHASSSPIFQPLIYRVPSLVQEQKAQQQRFLSACFAEIISTVSSYVDFTKKTHVLHDFRRICIDRLENIRIRKSLSSSAFPYRNNTFLLVSQVQLKGGIKGLIYKNTHPRM